MFSSQQIELITQGVLQEPRSRGVVVTAADATASDSSVDAVPKVTANAVEVSTTVLTEDSLAAINAAGQTLSVPYGAVITPSGHDYIRRHGITISTAAVPRGDSAGGVLIAAGSIPAAAVAAETARWQVVEVGCEFEAAGRAASHLPQPVVCCVAEPAVAACLLNRDAAVRAAVITQHTDIRVLGRLMNPHVVCLNSVGWSFAAVLQLLRQLSAAGNAAPAGWKETVGGAR